MEANFWIKGSETDSEQILDLLKQYGNNEHNLVCNDVNKIYYIKNNTIEQSNIDSDTAIVIMDTYSERKLDTTVSSDATTEFDEITDKQLVIGWDDGDFCVFTLGFYDKENDCMFCYNGERAGNSYDHYEPYKGPIIEYLKDAYSNLED